MDYNGWLRQSMERSLAVVELVLWDNTSVSGTPSSTQQSFEQLLQQQGMTIWEVNQVTCKAILSSGTSMTTK